MSGSGGGGGGTSAISLEEQLAELKTDEGRKEAAKAKKAAR